jgi:hypothetical protein
LLSAQFAQYRPCPHVPNPIDPRKLWLVWLATIGISEIGSRM